MPDACRVSGISPGTRPTGPRRGSGRTARFTYPGVGTQPRGAHTVRPRKARTLKRLLGSALAIMLALPHRSHHQPGQRQRRRWRWRRTRPQPVRGPDDLGEQDSVTRPGQPVLRVLGAGAEQGRVPTWTTWRSSSARTSRSPRTAACSCIPQQSVLPTGFTYGQMTPDTGNVNPFTVGTPIHAQEAALHGAPDRRLGHHDGAEVREHRQPHDLAGRKQRVVPARAQLQRLRRL